MAYLINLQTFHDQRGNLSVMDDVEQLLPFRIKRVFYIYGVDDSERGGHRHHATIQAAICIHGSCVVRNHDGNQQQDFVLNHPSKCLILEPQDWHLLRHFSPDAVLLVFASTVFDAADYIFEPYPEK
jgi:hypothetical protein